jgi:hypothetical protein
MRMRMMSLVAAIILLALCASGGIAIANEPLLIGQSSLTRFGGVVATTTTITAVTGAPAQASVVTSASAEIKPVPSVWVTQAMEWAAGMYGIGPEALNRDIPAGTVYLGSEGALMNAVTGIPQATAKGFATTLVSRWSGVGYSGNFAFAAAYGQNIMKPGTLEGSISTIVILVFDIQSQKVVPYYFWVNTLTQKPVYEPFPCFA